MFLVFIFCSSLHRTLKISNCGRDSMARCSRPLACLQSFNPDRGVDIMSSACLDSGSRISRRIIQSFIAFIMFTALLSGAFAQVSQGTLSGTTSDPSGAVLTNSKVTATNTATGETFNTTTNSDGLFVFPLLPVGPYKIAATHDGFNTLVQNVRITVGAKIDLSLKLPLATGVQTVQVSAEAPVVETTRTSQSDTVGDRQIANLPTNGRNFLDFTLLTPGVVRDVRGGDLSFAGQRGTLNSLTVDGTDNNNTFFGQTLGRTGSGRAPYQFSQDAVQEFQVNTNGYSAELGRAGG